MELIIEPTRATPLVKFNIDKGTFEISGRSMPENAARFYNPIVKWLEQHVVNQDLEAGFVINLEYFNTGSYIGLMTIFNKLDDLNARGSRFQVKWYHEESDMEAIDDAKSFQSVLKVPFELIAT